MFQSTPSCEGELAGRIRTRFLARFNPRPLARANRTMLLDYRVKLMFQSTPSCEGELAHRLAIMFFLCFNPRPLARANKSRRFDLLNVGMFQSTPSCEGERSGIMSEPFSSRFNPRPLARANAPDRRSTAKPPVSIHALLRGRTRSQTILESDTQVFQSTPSCEGERAGLIKGGGGWEFQSTPSCEGERPATI